VNLEIGAWNRKEMKGAEQGSQMSTCLHAAGQQTNKETQIAWGFLNYIFVYLFICLPSSFFSREGADSLYYFFFLTLEVC